MDNSDFTNPVNQRGFTTGSELNYTIDRWRIQNSGTTVTVDSGGINVYSTDNMLLYQRLNNVKVGKTYTFAVGLDDGTIGVLNFTYKETTNSFSWLVSPVKISDSLNIGIGYGATVKLFAAFSNRSDSTVRTIWAALYEGEYTADTLPEYQPKGYAVELAECQRYYYKIKGYWKWAAAGICVSDTSAMIPIKLPQAMKSMPTVSISDSSLIKVRCGAIGAQIPSGIAWTYVNILYDTIQMAATVTGATNGDVAFLYIDNGGEIQFSADL